MFRARRYRALLVFAAIFVLAVIHFTSSRDQPSVSVGVPPPVDYHATPSQNVPAPDNSTPNKEEPAAPAAQSPLSSPLVPSPDSPSSQGSDDSTSPKAPGHDGPAGDISAPSPSAELPKPSKVATDWDSYDKDVVASGTPEPPEKPHWKKVTENFPVKAENMIKLPSGRSKTLPKLQAKFKDETSTDKIKRLDRLSTVKSAFEHAWSGYKSSAMGHDEVKPLRGGYKDSFNGWGATLVDALDTLWIMDLKEEFSIAVDQIKKIDFTTSESKRIPVFEVAIRYMGGLLGAYDISGHKYDVLLDKAVELGEILIGAFDTPNRMPMLYYNWAPEYASKPHHGEQKAVLAELGSLSIEFTRLAQLTKNNKYYDAIARITNELEKYQSQTSMPGLWPLTVDASGCKTAKSQPQAKLAPERAPERADDPTSIQKAGSAPTDAESYKNLLEPLRIRGLPDDAQPADYSNLSGGSSDSKPEVSRPPGVMDCTGGLASPPLSSIEEISLGARGDSTYEYLPKEYMLLGGLNEQYQTMYKDSMKSVREDLVFQPMIKADRDVRFVASVKSPRPEMSKSKPIYSYEGTHLTCFVGGMVAVGAKVFEIEGDMKLAAQLTDGCVWAYESTATGIMPEHFNMFPCKKGEPCEWNEAEYYSFFDPHPEQRIAKAEKPREEEPEMTKESQEKPSSTKTPASSTRSPTPVSSSSTPLNKRAPELGNWHVVASPTPSPAPKTNDQVKDRNVNKKIDPAAPHEEYVKAKLERERLFPGAVSIPHRDYLLRPEAIESVFIMYRLTGDDAWREKGWKMFQAVSRYTRTDLANAELYDVTVEEPRMYDNMQSFWLAETLKYFYLLFSDPDVVNLDEFVLNTEAHPMKRPEY